MRVWRGKDNNDGSLHSMGNGKLCVYGQGPDVVQIFGPPYSSPSLMGIYLLTEGITAESDRTSGTAVWKHSLSDRSELSDFVDWSIPCFVRKIASDSALKFFVKLADDVDIVENTKLLEGSGYSGGYIIYSKAGRPYYNDYP